MHNVNKMLVLNLSCVNEAATRATHSNRGQCQTKCDTEVWPLVATGPNDTIHVSSTRIFFMFQSELCSFKLGIKTVHGLFVLQWYRRIIWLNFPSAVKSSILAFTIWHKPSAPNTLKDTTKPAQVLPKECDKELQNSPDPNLTQPDKMWSMEVPHFHPQYKLATHRSCGYPGHRKGHVTVSPQVRAKSVSHWDVPGSYLYER